jgi:methylated-DNA-[protein]-cysteine S-methyltransferase
MRGKSHVKSVYSIFHTAAGWVGILSSPAGIKRVTLPQKSEDEAREALGSGPVQAAPADGGLNDLIAQFRGYYSGRRVVITGSPDLSAATPFQRDVWQAARLIPYGETRSYRWVAEKIGKPGAARAVGQALGKNPCPVIVPCHRVLNNNGGLGGFSGGIEMKKQLLKLEGAPISRGKTGAAAKA